MTFFQNFLLNIGTNETKFSLQIIQINFGLTLSTSFVSTEYRHTTFNLMMLKVIFRKKTRKTDMASYVVGIKAVYAHYGYAIA